ncbi:MAG TPA: hypothetical protein VKU02_20970, partial [Gemmataceae bacterium]|nr:hypothetical protein [Gemmataceae bacterium]
TMLTNGTGMFTATLKTAGTWSLAATDTANSSLTGNQTGIVVNPGAATHFTISAPSSVASLSVFSITITALDAYGNTATGYLGTVGFSSSNSNDYALMPSSYKFTSSDRGVHTIVGLRLLGSGQHTITVFDMSNRNTQGSFITNVS